MLRFFLMILLCTMASQPTLAHGNDWITISLLIFKQKAESAFTMPATIHFNPELPSPEEQMARNINAMQLPTLHNRHIQAWQSMLEKAGYEIRYTTQWQQPEPTDNDYSQHYLLNFKWEAPPTTEINKTNSENDPTTIPAPESHAEQASTPPPSTNASYVLIENTQGHLHALLPSLFTNHDWLLPSYNPWVRGTISLQSHGYYYQMKVDLYGFKEDQGSRPSLHWVLNIPVKLGDTRYIDNDQWGMIVAIKRSNPPESLSTQHPPMRETKAEAVDSSPQKS